MDHQGMTPWSRTYLGKQAVRREPLAPSSGGSPGPTPIEPSESSTTAIECEGNVITRSGKPYCNSYCCVVEMVDGKFTSLTEYLDTVLVEQALEPPQ
jgi:ketosteroid isomerase-like protein